MKNVSILSGSVLILSNLRPPAKYVMGSRLIDNFSELSGADNCLIHSGAIDLACERAPPKDRTEIDRSRSTNINNI